MVVEQAALEEIFAREQLSEAENESNEEDENGMNLQHLH